MKTHSPQRIEGHRTGLLVLSVFTRLLKIQIIDRLHTADAYPARRPRCTVSFPESGDLRVQGNSHFGADEVSPPARCNGLGIDHQSSMSVSSPTVIPNFSDPVYGGGVLREKCDSAKVLGLVRCQKAEILVIYDGEYLSLSLFMV